MRALLEESIQRILADHVTPNVLQSAEVGEWQKSLFNLLDQGGFTRALAAEVFGGSEATWSDVFPVVVASGHYALPLPLAESLVASWLLDRCGIQVPAGGLTLAEASQGLRMEKSAGSWRLNGLLSGVAWGRSADFIVTSIAHDQAHRLVLLSRTESSIENNQNIAREPRDRLLLNNVSLEAVAPLPKEWAFDVAKTYGALIRSAQMAGAMQRALEFCVQYANDRIQFGKPIAKFQAIQQQMAVLASESASATAAAEFAFLMAEQGDPGFAVACAKIRTSEAAGKVAAIAHAVHGAIGFTYEHTLHYLTRRLWSWRSEFGTHAYWSEQLGRQVCEKGGNGMWPMITEQRVRSEV